jgi:uncharacterized protein with FMN-binding domain
MPPEKNNKPKIVSAIVIVVLIALFIVARQMSGTDSLPTDTTTPTDIGTSTEPVVTNDKKYKDGTYSATGTYSSPAGNETVDVTLTLKDGIITDATFVGNSKNHDSKTVQDMFAKGYKAVVIGKPIATLSLNVVNGSSLTPKGFMDAVSKIKTQAQI